MIGTTVGSYRITAKVSIGGMGTVYRAEHTLIGKHAAVKVLHPELRNNRDVVQRFFNEAKSTTQIKHPGIVEVFDFGYLPTGDGYIVMEFLEGMSLARRLKKVTKMHEGEAAVLMRSVCSALAAAHAKGIVHRDLKPDNIFLSPDPDAATGERPKILDFGIAKLNVGLTGPGNATKTGAVMGTPTYMSPEQCRGTGEVDHRADLYSIGCMFYEMVAGRPPFTDLGAGELIGAHLYIEPVKPTACGATISPAAEQLIMSLLEKKPEKRPQTAVELGRRFAELAQGHGLVARVTPTSLHTVDYKPEVEDMRATTPRKPDPADEIAPTALSTPGTGSLSTPRKAELGTDVTIAAQPTTLSGAASQSVMRNRGSRLPIYIGIAAAVMVAGGVTMFALKGSSKSSSPAAQPAAAAPSTTDTTPAATPPAATAAAPTAAATTPATTAAPTTATTPAPTAPAPAATTAPATSPTTAPTAGATTPATTTAPAETTKPETTKPTTSVTTTKPTTKPATTKPATTKPTTAVTTSKPTTKPTTTKPTTKPTTTKPTEKPATTKPTLIETDI